jgi:CheY-like chemotaxis protein
LESEAAVRTVLVIDDNVAVLSTLIYLLEEAGYHVVSAENGHAGVRIYISTQPDLVIADLIMPEQGGIQTIREIKRLCPEAKIIAISGGARIGNTDPLEAAREVGAIATLAKPLDPDDFIEAVNAFLAA